MLRDLEENIRLSDKGYFQEVSKSWTDSSAENYANSTFQGYLWYLSRYLLPVFEDKYMDEIEPKHLQIFVNELSKQYSAETVNKNINILSNIFQHAVTLQLKCCNQSVFGQDFCMRKYHKNSSTLIILTLTI